VRDTYAGAFWLPRPRDGGIWWDGYDGQEFVVVDEFEGWFPQVVFKNLINHTPLMVETKGGSVPFLAKTVIFMSNTDPSLWWKRGWAPGVQRRMQEPIGEIHLVISPMWQDEGSEPPTQVNPGAHPSPTAIPTAGMAPTVIDLTQSPEPELGPVPPNQSELLEAHSTQDSQEMELYFQELEALHT
jgi:hypothetical protein